MSRYPINQYSHERNDDFLSNRSSYINQSQTQPPVALHLEGSRSFANPQLRRHFAPVLFGAAPNVGRNPSNAMQLRPASPGEQPWSHLRATDRGINHESYHYGNRFSQPLNLNHNRPVMNSGIANDDFNVSMPPVPQWRNPNALPGMRSPHIPIQSSHVLPNSMHPFPAWGQQLHQRLDQQNITQSFPWTPTATSAGHEKSKEYDDQSNSDRAFLDKFLSSRNICKTVDENKQKAVKIHELQKELQNYLKCIDELKTCKDVLMQFIGTDDSNWQEIVKKTMSIKEILEKMQFKLFHSEYMKGAVNSIKKRKIKRERQKNIRMIKAQLKEEKQKEIILAHQRIDAWRHGIVSEINAKKMVDSLKSEAGQSLTEVRKKIFDFIKYLEKVDSAKELRGIRRQTALQRGIFIFGDQDEQFEKRVENMKSVVKKRLEVYSSEEKTLMVMLEEEKEQLQREDDTKRKKLMEKEHMRLFGYDPLVECRRYWLQAEVNPLSLVQIRRLWDVYLVPSTMVGADYIPDGWVTPGPSKNVAWNKYLRKKL